MELPGAQVELIKAVAGVNNNTVVVLNNGSPLAMTGWIENVAAIVDAWFPGQECGNAIADVLFGGLTLQSVTQSPQVAGSVLRFASQPLLASASQSP